jgi:hypothetical protein
MIKTLKKATTTYNHNRLSGGTLLKLATTITNKKPQQLAVSPIPQNIYNTTSITTTA